MTRTQAAEDAGISKRQAVTAIRIQARAIQRSGQLIKQIESQKGKRNQHTVLSGSVPTKQTRKEAAEDAGISKDQAVTAVRVANIPEEKFDAQAMVVERDNRRANGQRDSGKGGDRKSASRDTRVKLSDLGTTQNQPESRKLFECKKCSETFTEPMWHCSRCAHHWQIQRMATRIRARAILRLGQLIKQIDKSKGGRPKKTGGSAPTSYSRKQAAEEAGISKRQHPDDSPECSNGEAADKVANAVGMSRQTLARAKEKSSDTTLQDLGITRAERQAGVILKEMKVNGQRDPGKGGDRKSESRNMTVNQTLSDLDTTRDQPESRKLFECKKCSETFTEAVWHCSKCAHHWQIQRHETDGHNLECRNCHKTNTPPSRTPCRRTAQRDEGKRTETNRRKTGK